MVKNNLHQTISWEVPSMQQQQPPPPPMYMPGNQKEIYPWMNDKNKNAKKSSTTGKV